MSHEQVLAMERLLAELFVKNEELLVVLRQHRSVNRNFVDGLPPAESVAPANFRMNVVDRLEAHSIVDAELFAVVADARPNALSRIKAVARQFGIDEQEITRLASKREGGQPAARGTHVLILEGPVGGTPSGVANDEVRAALAPDCEVSRFRLDLNDLDSEGGDPEIWVKGQTRIRNAVRRYLTETVCVSDARHVSVFGLAPIPWLMSLGYAISETIPSRVYNRLREPASWGWEDDRPELGRWSWRRFGGTVGARRAVIMISASAEVKRERVERVLPLSESVAYEIALSHPKLDAVRCEAQLGEFGRVYRGVLDEIERIDRGVEEIHLFAAVPVAIAVDCGRRILHSAIPPIVTYKFTARGYVPAVTLKS